MVSGNIGAIIAKETIKEVAKETARKSIEQLLERIKSKYGILSISATLILDFKTAIPLFDWRTIVIDTITKLGAQRIGEIYRINSEGCILRIIGIKEYIIAVPPEEEINFFEYENEEKEEGQEKIMVRKGYIMLTPEVSCNNTIQKMAELMLKIAKKFEGLASAKIFVRIYSRSEDKENMLSKIKKKLKEAGFQAIIDREPIDVEKQLYEPYLKLDLELDNIINVRKIDEILFEGTLQRIFKVLRRQP